MFAGISKQPDDKEHNTQYAQCRAPQQIRTPPAGIPPQRHDKIATSFPIHRFGLCSRGWYRRFTICSVKNFATASNFQTKTSETGRILHNWCFPMESNYMITHNFSFSSFINCSLPKIFRSLNQQNHPSSPSSWLGLLQVGGMTLHIHLKTSKKSSFYYYHFQQGKALQNEVTSLIRHQCSKRPTRAIFAITPPGYDRTLLKSKLFTPQDKNEFYNQIHTVKQRLLQKIIWKTSYTSPSGGTPSIAGSKCYFPFLNRFNSNSTLSDPFKVSNNPNATYFPIPQHVKSHFSLSLYQNISTFRGMNHAWERTLTDGPSLSLINAPTLYFHFCWNPYHMDYPRRNRGETIKTHVWRNDAPIHNLDFQCFYLLGQVMRASRALYFKQSAHTSPGKIRRRPSAQRRKYRYAFSI